MPPLAVYIEESMDEKEVGEITEWYNERKKSPFYLKHELAAYCTLDTHILLMIVCSFLKQWYIIQKEMIEYFIKKASSEEIKEYLKDAYFHPFGASFSTLSSFCYSLCRFFQLNRYHISLVDDEKGNTHT